MGCTEEPSEDETQEESFNSDQKGTEEKRKESEANSDDTKEGNDEETSESNTSDENEEDDNSECDGQSSPNAVVNTAITNNSSGDESNSDEICGSVDESSPRTVLDTPIDQSLHNAKLTAISRDFTHSSHSGIVSSDENNSDEMGKFVDESSPRTVLDTPIDQSSPNAALVAGISEDRTHSDGHVVSLVKNSCCHAAESSAGSELDVAESGSTDSSGSSNGVISVDQSAESSHSSHWKNMITGLLLMRRRKSSMVRVSAFPPRTKSSGFRHYLERMRSGKGSMVECSSVIAPEMLPEISKWRPSWRSFDYEELATATDGFGPENLIGKGGHAEVYKGRLADGQLVAVKRLTKGGDKEDRISDFLSELGIIAHVNHPNAAQLLGFSVEGGLHLVLQFSPHGSLASVLHGVKKCLEWKMRLRIAIGVAEGLVYLHEGCHRRIIHRDIKASNVLLTDDFQAQISDFGLAKWLPDKWSHHVVFPIEGTFGYMAPEYFMHGVINEKTDVFAFGVLLLELITGRKAVDSSRQSLVIWAKPLLDSNNMKLLVDPSLSDDYNAEEMSRVLAVASMCIHHNSSTRPSMKSVVRLLKDKEGSSVELIARPKAITKPLMFDASCDSEDYTRSSYLNDLHRHMQLALEQ